MKHMRPVLTLLQDAGVTIKFEKSELFSITITNLGHAIHTRKIAESQHTIDKMHDFKPLTNTLKLRSFLGL